MGDIAELLKRAVVCLEKKLRAAEQAGAALHEEVRRLQCETEELPVVQSRLAEALAAQRDLAQQRDEWQRQAAQAQAEVEVAQLQKQGAQTAQQAAEAAQEQQATQAAQWRADCEALQIGQAQAEGRAELLEQQVQQLEAANNSLRADNQHHAARLKEAYEREGELLVQVADVQAQLRRALDAQHKDSSSRNGGCRAADGPPAPAATSGVDLSPPASSMEQLHRDLFVAAAQQLTREHCAKVEQAERKAGELEQRLEGAREMVEQMQQQASELRAGLEAAQAQCSREQETAQALLASNMRLHETMALLMEHAAAAGAAVASDGAPGDVAACSGGVAALAVAPHPAGAAAGCSGAPAAGQMPPPRHGTNDGGRVAAALQPLQPEPRPQAPSAQQRQSARRRLPGMQHPMQQPPPLLQQRQTAVRWKPSAAFTAATSRQTSTGTEVHEQQVGMQDSWQGRGQQHTDYMPAATCDTGLKSSMQAKASRRPAQRGAAPARWLATGAASARVAASQQQFLQHQVSKQQQQEAQREQQQQQEAVAAAAAGAEARRAAVQAALALSAEHRELQARCKAASAELQRTASCLAVAAPSQQLQLLRHHAELQRELREVAAQLEDCAVRLVALRQAGLL